jgi:hypothetical protein
MGVTSMPSEYRQPSTKALPPVPPNFAENFIRGGWRQIERMYGCRDDRLIKWQILAGGERLNRARTEYRFGRVTFDQAMAELRAVTAGNAGVQRDVEGVA